MSLFGSWWSLKKDPLHRIGQTGKLHLYLQHIQPKTPSRDVNHAQLLIIITHRLNLAQGVFDVSRELLKKRKKEIWAWVQLSGGAVA